MNGLQQLALLVLITLAAVGLLAMRRKVFARMALRNIARRKRFAVIIVSGLLVATAMISGALVVGDTLDYLIKKSVFDSTGNVDIVFLSGTMLDSRSISMRVSPTTSSHPPKPVILRILMAWSRF